MALGNFLKGLRKDLTITMFHYRNHGAGKFGLLIVARSHSARVELTPIDVGKVLVGVQVPPDASDEFEQYLEELGYPYVEETENMAYKMFLCS